MSKAPQTLIDLRHFFVEQTGRAGKNFGIRGFCEAGKRKWGFHLGKAEIYSPTCGYGDKDYSIRHRRNKRALTDFSAGFDIRLPVGILKRLTAYLVEKGQTGWRDPASGKRLLFEVIGPDETGAAKRWAKDTGWKPTKGRADHEWHIHIGFWRDTEFIDKRPMFFEFFGVDEVPQPDDDPGSPMEPEQGETPADDAPMPEPSDDQIGQDDASEPPSPEEALAAFKEKVRPMIVDIRTNANELGGQMTNLLHEFEPG